MGTPTDARAAAAANAARALARRAQCGGSCRGVQRGRAHLVFHVHVKHDHRRSQRPVEAEQRNDRARRLEAR